MNSQKTIKYLLSKPETIEAFPFGPEVAVFKIKNKIFALLVEENGIARINLKCEPMEALALREIFPAITAGYHMNKKHWNTVVLDSSIPVKEIERMIDRSYTLVVRGLKKSERAILELQYGEATLYR